MGAATLTDSLQADQRRIDARLSAGAIGVLELKKHGGIIGGWAVWSTAIGLRQIGANFRDDS